jgi:hypothetical protein
MRDFAVSPGINRRHPVSIAFGIVISIPIEYFKTKYIYGTPIQYTDNELNRQTTKSLINELRLPLSESLPEIKADRINPSKNPKLGLNMYDGPPPDVKTGIPARPSPI